MEMKYFKLLFVNLLIFVILATPALSQTNDTTANQTTTATTTPTVVATTVEATATSTTAAAGKFRVGPSVTLRPVTDVIEANQDGIVELFMNNPSLNDVTLNVDAQISVPSGIHVYGQSFGQAAGAGVVSGTFSVPPGTARTIAVVVKADSSARIGSHTLQFTGLYWPGDNKDAFQPLSLTYSVTVKEASKNPTSPDIANPSAVPTGAETPKVQIPGFDALLTIFGVFAIALLLSRKI
jgi:hypothetical protein